MTTPKRAPMLTQSAEYALRAAVHIARDATRRPVRAGEMARALRIPQEYLAKILRRLARAGVLISTRGKAGGFRLAAPPQRVRLHAIVAPFDDLGGPRRCLLGRPHCSDRFACAAHDRWRRVADAMNEFLRQTTLADVARNGAPTE